MSLLVDGRSRTAAQQLKMFAPTASNQISIGSMLRGCLEDKDFDFNVIRQLALERVFAELFIGGFLNGAEGDGLSEEGLNFLCRDLDHITKSQKVAKYKGLPSQNLVIDRALAASNIRREDSFYGEGATTKFNMEIADIPAKVTAVPIAIVGFGAAGIIANFALRAQGFQNIHVYEKSSDELGI